MLNVLRKTAILALLFVSGTCFGQYSDEQLYEAYMSSDLTLWGEYIAHTKWDTLSAEGRTRLINYYYGYIPFRHDNGGKDCRALLDTYWALIRRHQDVLTESEYKTFLSSAYAYEYLLDHGRIFSDGMKSYKVAKEAVEADENNPLALALKGNVDFYAPKLFGGSKKRAMRAFLKAEKIMHNDAKYRYYWNYPSLQLCIAQCYEKQGDLDEAIEQCRKLLAEHPHFAYVRDEYLPALLKKKSKKED